MNCTHQSIFMKEPSFLNNKLSTRNYQNYHGLGIRFQHENKIDLCAFLYNTRQIGT